MDITKFGLSNFRIFKEHFDFDLSPIMVLTGPNNSGKSSLSKALLLLKANEENLNKDSHFSTKLNYFLGEHDLGTHKYTINTQGINTNFSFTFFQGYKVNFEINNDGEFIHDYKITTKEDKLVIQYIEYNIQIDVENIIAYFKVRLACARTKQNSDLIDSSHKRRVDFNSLSESDLDKIEELIFHLEKFGQIIEFIGMDLYDLSYLEWKYKKDLVTLKSALVSKDIILQFFDDYQEAYLDLFEWQENLIYFFYKLTSMELTKEIIQYLIPTSKYGYLSLSDLTYVNTIKEPFKRAYSRNDVSSFQKIITNQIFNDISPVIHRTETRYNYKRLIKDENASESDERSYINFIQKWLREFEIGDELSYGYDEENDIYFIKIDNKSLPEYGLGYGLIIHILLAISNEVHAMRFKGHDDLILRFPPTYIIEEPETGLHPAFQSKMAEMIVDIQKTFDVNLIIETHSEYFIRKLQYLTANNDIKPDDAVIYYFNNPKKVPDNEDQIKKITIDKNGSLSDIFGTGFIDVGTNIKFELLRLINNQQN